jgi:hypothetical protein
MAREDLLIRSSQTADHADLQDRVSRDEETMLITEVKALRLGYYWFILRRERWLALNSLNSKRLLLEYVTKCYIAALLWQITCIQNTSTVEKSFQDH